MCTNADATVEINKQTESPIKKQGKSHPEQSILSMEVLTHSCRDISEWKQLYSKEWWRQKRDVGNT